MTGHEKYFTQETYEVRCEWGLAGTRRLAPESDVIIIVDVLSFSTSVDIALQRAVCVYPYAGKDPAAADFSRSVGALLADGSGEHGYSLSPATLLHLPPAARLVLPSPNGSRISLATGSVPTFAGCLRNAEAVATAAQQIGGRISLIPAGEQWADGSLRPAFEDLIGAGAILHFLSGTRAPEAEAAWAAFQHFQDRLSQALRDCSSGKELIGRGRALDVELAAAWVQSENVPQLVEGAYIKSPR